MKSRLIYTWLIILTVVFTSNVSGQNCNTVVDSYYIISVHYLVDGDSPINRVVLVKNLDAISLATESIQELDCSLYKHGLYMISPPFGIEEEITRCFGDSATRIYESNYPAYIEGLNRLDRFSEKNTILLDDSKEISIHISKAVCELWTFNIANKNQYEPSVQIAANNNCIAGNQGFILKEVRDVYTLDSGEIRAFKEISIGSMQ